MSCNDLTSTCTLSYKITEYSFGQHSVLTSVPETKRSIVNVMLVEQQQNICDMIVYKETCIYLSGYCQSGLVLVIETP